MLSSSQTNEARDFVFTDKEFRFLAGLANQKTGIVLTEQKRDMVYGRLTRRLRALRLRSFAEYCDLLQSDAFEDELPHLVNAITTNLTGFFREAHHFDHLHEQAAEWKRQGKKRLRLWSSACSSGMEPYSMAMTLRQSIPDIDSWDAKILATDIDSNMLAKGTAGEYGASDVEQVPPACQKAFIEPLAGGRVSMGDELRRLVTFRQLNLLESWPMRGKFDVVFCRNVVIYFDKPTKEVLFDRIADVMEPRGLLYIGHSENLHGITDRFELLGRTIYRRIR
ncbi:MAG: protein-glutamate O-methyltransferase CheR [Alphaproteobacteria bacterium]|nr:protein-glutamate O-methyltransferase CheR [Alphaproteobacteria bacterium]